MERGKSSTGNPLYYETNFYRPEPEVEDRKQLSVYSAERTPGESQSSHSVSQKAYKTSAVKWI